MGVCGPCDGESTCCYVFLYEIRTPIVPDPHTLSTQVPGNSKWFSVVNFANTFFCIPVDPASQFWFAFQFNGKPYAWTRIPQVYCESPAVFSAALHDNLAHLVLPGGSTLIQYVNDLLVCSPDSDVCEQETIVLLQFLASQGQKASVAKLQFLLQKVKFLGHIITPDGRSLSEDRIKAIQNVPKPITKRQLMGLRPSYVQAFLLEEAAHHQVLVAAQ